MENRISKEPLIILIGGAAGTGKTTLANELCSKLSIPHRLGSGFIREIAKNFISKENSPSLYSYSFKPKKDMTPFDNLYKQSEVIKGSIDLCIKRAYREGTSIVIEGVNIIPGLISSELVILFIILTINDPIKHRKMICGETHFKRKISESDFNNIRKIQEKFKDIASKHNVPTIAPFIVIP